MKEEKAIKQKFNAMCEANAEYINLIAKTLTDFGHPFYVADDQHEQRGIWFRVIEDDRAVHCTVDMVRCDNNLDIFVHKTEWDYNTANEWTHIDSMGDAKDYILENILWLTRDDLMHIASDNHDGALIDIMNASDVTIYFMERLSDMVEEVVDLDYFEDSSGGFFVHRYEWSKAMKDVDEHEED